MKFPSLVYKYFIFFLAFFLVSYNTSIFAMENDCNHFDYSHFYTGLAIAYGETTWNQLRTHDLLVEVSAPKETHDSGSTWGGFIGYQFKKNFAIEAHYMRYPNTRLIFDNFSFYYPVTELTTRTQVYSAITKFILPLSNSHISSFLDAGIAFTHRSDIFAKVTRVAPTFGLGFSFDASHNIVTEIGFEYYIGYGKSNHMPIKDFVPFLFSLYFRLGYRLF